MSRRFDPPLYLKKTRPIWDDLSKSGRFRAGTIRSPITGVYVSDRFASDNDDMIRIVKYVIWIYIPAWFHVVRSPSILEGPRILQGIVANMLEGSKTIPFKTVLRMTTKRVKPTSEMGVMQDSINRNGYFAHCEWVLLSMLTDPESKDLRKKARDTIFNIRQWKEAKPATRRKEPEIRLFRPPKIQWEKVTSYDKFIPSLTDMENLTEPPMTMRLTADRLNAIVEDPTVFDVEDLVCHTQAIERHIPLVTKVAETYPVEDTEGETSRFEQEMSNTIFSRQRMPTYKHKYQWVSLHVEPGDDDLLPPLKIRKLRSQK